MYFLKANVQGCYQERRVGSCYSPIWLNKSSFQSTHLLQWRWPDAVILHYSVLPCKSHVKRLKVQDICCVESLPVKFNLLHFCNSWLGLMLLILLNTYTFFQYSLPMNQSFSDYLLYLLLYLQDFPRLFVILSLSRKPFPTRDSSQLLDFNIHNPQSAHPPAGICCNSSPALLQKDWGRLPLDHLEISQPDTLKNIAQRCQTQGPWTKSGPRCDQISPAGPSWKM